MQLITEKYRELNQQLHKENIHYGVGGYKHLDNIIRLAKDLKTQDILDYGCGKCYLSDNLPFSIKKYDPSIPAHSELPNPADIVVCTDVLEHIEPALLDNVLEHMLSLTKKVGFFTIAFNESLKKLPDGRNAHLIQEGGNWWIDKITKKFNVMFFQIFGESCVIVVKPQGEVNA